MRGAELSTTGGAVTLPRGRLGVVLRAAACVLAVAPLLRWMVIAHSVHSGRLWRDSCPRCALKLGPLGDLLALSPLARCGRCGQRLGSPPWTLELVAVLSAAALFGTGVRGLSLVAYGWWAGIGVVLAFVDLAVQRLPARLSYAAAGGLVAVLLADAWLANDWWPWVRSVLGAFVTAGIIALCALVLPALVHWGDVGSCQPR